MLNPATKVSWVFGTSNACDIYRRDPDQTDDMLAQFVDPVLDIVTGDMQEGRLNAENVMPVIKPASYLEEVGNAEELLVYEPWVDGLFVVYMLDLPTAVRGLRTDELTELGIDLEALPALALANLARVLGDSLTITQI